LLVEGLRPLQVDYLTEVQDCLNHVQVELAEDRVVVVETQMADVHLHFFSRDGFVATELLPDFEEPFFDLALDAGLQLLLHVVQLQVLAFEVLEWQALFFVFCFLDILHDRSMLLRLLLLNWVSISAWWSFGQIASDCIDCWSLHSSRGQEDLGLVCVVFRQFRSTLMAHTAVLGSESWVLLHQMAMRGMLVRTLKLFTGQTRLAFDLLKALLARLMKAFTQRGVDLFNYFALGFFSWFILTTQPQTTLPFHRCGDFNMRCIKLVRWCDLIELDIQHVW